MAEKPPRTIFVCQSCGYKAPKWLGKCPDCGAWNSLVEELLIPAAGAGDLSSLGPESSPVPLVSLTSTAEDRQLCGVAEFDRALGGGVVPGSVILLGGDPGIGKSTLMLQVLDSLCGSQGRGLYVSGEESSAQLKLRADRLGITAPGLLVATETCLDNIYKMVEAVNPDYLVLDSIQTLYTATLPAAPGSISQVRETAFRLVQLAKSSGRPIFLIGHVTKEGAIAGPKLLEHMVDTVLYFEGDRGHAFRLLRTVKNRFGPTQELGVFEMRESGLSEVTNPSELLLSERSLETPGSVVVPCVEGSRPILVELQALVTPSSLALPRRQAMGVDPGRVSLLVAVLEKRVGLALGGQDLFVNAAGGVRLTEPAVDLGIIAALASSFLDRPLPADTLVFGEVGLTGEVRTVGQAELRLKEGNKLGFRRVVLARGHQARLPALPGLQLLEVADVAQALRTLFPSTPRPQAG